MKSNPYEDSATTQTHKTRWMFVVGVVALILSTVCLDAAVISMFGAFQILSEPGANVQPSELASSISRVVAFWVATLPLGY